MDDRITVEMLASLLAKHDKLRLMEEFIQGVALFKPGVDQDIPKAVQLFRAGAEQGHAESQFALSRVYQDGNGVQQNLATAAMWARRAAEQGMAAAQCDLGLYLSHGLGVPKDEVEAMVWSRKAAEQGNVTAQSMLGAAYSLGNGVAKDVAEAKKWLTLAAAQGDSASQTILNLIAIGEEADQLAEESENSFRQSLSQAVTIGAVAVLAYGAVYLYRRLLAR